MNSTPAPALDSVRPGLLRWIWSAAIEPFDGRFHFSREMPRTPVLYTTAYAVLALECMDALRETDAPRRAAMADYMRSFQTDQGWFVDDGITYVNQDPKRLDRRRDYTRWHQTFCTLEALDALGADPARDLEFLNDFDTAKKFDAWLKTLDMSQSWMESNRIMSLLGAYFFAYDRGGDRRWLEVAGRVLDRLESIQDAKTGLWGTDCGASLATSVAGTYHYLMFFYALDRPVPHAERIIDSTLKLQVRRGNFAPCGGSSCLDLDAFDVLVNLSHYTDHRVDEIRQVAVRINRVMAAMQNPDGGFAETKGKLFNLADALDMVAGLLRHRCFGTFVHHLKYPVKTKLIPGHRSHVGGIVQQAAPWPASNMWSAWFRPLVMAEACDRFPEAVRPPKTFTPKFRRLPGLGYKAQPYVRT